jgi:hypothetical protein
VEIRHLLAVLWTLAADVGQAQTRPVSVTPGLAQGNLGRIYEGVLSIPQLGSYLDGGVTLARPTLATARISIRPPSWPVAFHGSAAFGEAEFRVRGTPSAGRFARFAPLNVAVPARVWMLALGISRITTFGPHLPQLEAGLGSVVTWFEADGSSAWGQALGTFRSPGLEGTVAVQYPGPRHRVGLEVRSTWAVLKHDTYRLNNGTQTTGQRSPASQWASNVFLGIGARIRL